MELTLNDILSILACIVFAWLMTARKASQPIVQTEIEEIVVEKEVRDTIAPIAPAGVSIKVSLECD